MTSGARRSFTACEPARIRCGPLPSAGGRDRTEGMDVQVVVLVRQRLPVALVTSATTRLPHDLNGWGWPRSSTPWSTAPKWASASPLLSRSWPPADSLCHTRCLFVDHPRRTSRRRKDCGRTPHLRPDWATRTPAHELLASVTAHEHHQVLSLANSNHRDGERRATRYGS